MAAKIANQVTLAEPQCLESAVFYTVRTAHLLHGRNLVRGIEGTLTPSSLAYDAALGHLALARGCWPHRRSFPAHGLG